MTHRPLRSTLIRLAHANPELRAHLLPLIFSVEGGGKQANILSDLWKKYKGEHPNAERPPKSLEDKAKKLEQKEEDPFEALSVSEKKMRDRDKPRQEENKKKEDTKPKKKEVKEEDPFARLEKSEKR